MLDLDVGSPAREMLSPHGARLFLSWRGTRFGRVEAGREAGREAATAYGKSVTTAVAVLSCLILVCFVLFCFVSTLFFFVLADGLVDWLVSWLTVLGLSSRVVSACHERAARIFIHTAALLLRWIYTWCACFGSILFVLYGTRYCVFSSSFVREGHSTAKRAGFPMHINVNALFFCGVTKSDKS